MGESLPERIGGDLTCFISLCYNSYIKSVKEICANQIQKEGDGQPCRAIIFVIPFAYNISVQFYCYLWQGFF